MQIFYVNRKRISFTSARASIKDYFTRGHQRSVKAKKNIFASFIIKGCNVAISLVLVPLTIHYIKPTQYGIWLTLSSIIGWFGFFDVGFGHGLRNKLAESIAKGDHEKARVYISTTYAILSIIISFLLLIYLCINPFLHWSKILNSPASMARELSLLALIVFVFFCFQFVLQLITIILAANQEPAKSALFNLLGSLLSLILIYVLTKTTSGNLIYLGLCLGFIPIIVLAFSSIWLYSHDYKRYAPSFKFVNFGYAHSLMSLGLKFFIIQIAYLVIYSTDNIIITQLYGPKAVLPYNIAFKYFTLITAVFSIIVSPYWSAFTDAYTKGDLKWIKDSMYVLLRLAVIFSLITIFMIIFSDRFYNFWVGDMVQVPFLLSVLVGSYFILSLFLQPLTLFINGTGKIKIQLIHSVFTALVNIPLAVFLSVYLKLGISGIILATIICYLPGMILAPIQYYKIANNSARGLWNK